MSSASNEVLLRCQALTRRWGGLIAVNEVSLALTRGSVHAVIGTNGAGKSTLINLLSGEFPPSSGQVELLGQDITPWTQARRARAGLGRSYQRNTIYPSFSVLENCRLSAQSRWQQPWAWWRNAQAESPALRTAREVAERVGLGQVLDRQAGLLSHGQKRQLEIAMCLATAPQVLLLDEPLAGMGAEETERMLALLADLKARHAILLVEPLAGMGAEETERMLQLLDALRTDHAVLLVEHDMDAVFRLADRVTVLVQGRVLTTGTVDAVRSDARVQAVYLGTEDQA